MQVHDVRCRRRQTPPQRHYLACDRGTGGALRLPSQPLCSGCEYAFAETVLLWRGDGDGMARRDGCGGQVEHDLWHAGDGGLGYVQDTQWSSGYRGPQLRLTFT